MGDYLTYKLNKQGATRQLRSFAKRQTLECERPRAVKPAGPFGSRGRAKARARMRSVHARPTERRAMARMSTRWTPMSSSSRSVRLESSMAILRASLRNRKLSRARAKQAVRGGGDLVLVEAAVPANGKAQGSHSCGSFFRPVEPSSIDGSSHIAMPSRSTIIVFAVQHCRFVGEASINYPTIKVS